MVTVNAPEKSRSRAEAEAAAAALPNDLRHSDVLLECRGTAIATPSFADEVLKQVLLQRSARHLIVVNAPDRFIELLDRAALRLGLADRLSFRV